MYLGPEVSLGVGWGVAAAIWNTFKVGALANLADGKIRLPKMDPYGLFAFLLKKSTALMPGFAGEALDVILEPNVDTENFIPVWTTEGGQGNQVRYVITEEAQRQQWDEYTKSPAYRFLKFIEFIQPLKFLFTMAAVAFLFSQITHPEFVTKLTQGIIELNPETGFLSTIAIAMVTSPLVEQFFAKPVFKRLTAFARPGK
jgi:hypothetical protein